MLPQENYVFSDCLRSFLVRTFVRDLYILVRQSPASYTTYRDRTRFFLLRDLVLAMVCVKKMSLCSYGSFILANLFFSLCRTTF